MPLVDKQFDEIIDFTRADPADFESESGTIETADADEPRFEFLDGEPQGLKFGDGDRAVSQPSLAPWYTSARGTLAIRAFGLGGETVFESGDTQIEGIDGWKTYVFRWNDHSDPLDNAFAFFPDEPDDGVTRYQRRLYFYPRFLEGGTLEFMLDFNELINEGFE